MPDLFRKQLLCLCSVLSFLIVVQLTGDVARSAETLSQPVSQMPQTSFSYRVDFSPNKHNLAYVTVDFGTQQPAECEVMMPAWTPGHYLMREYAKYLQDLRFTDDQPSGTDTSTETSTETNTVTKVAKNRWMTKRPPGTPLKLTYTIFAHQNSVTSSWIDSEYALIVGAAMFLTIDDQRQIPCVVKLELPESWKYACAAMPTAINTDNTNGSNVATFVAKDFTELVDSPILCGNPEISSFNVGGVEHHLINLDPGPFWDTQAAAKDVARLVQSQQEMWGIVPYHNYHFINIIKESGGGLEHDHSTVMCTSKWKYRDRSQYIGWLGLVSHEFFHTWNVRRLRPRGIAEYDYHSENYTKCLWIAEGLTSYYDDLHMIRSGVIDESEFFKQISKTVSAVQLTPGRHHQSLAESSLDTWIKYARPDENSVNSTISYYTKGATVGFLLDAKIRSATQGANSLDDVMRLLYQRHVGNGGYDLDDFYAAVKEFSNDDVVDWLITAVETTEELNFDQAMAYYGLERKPFDDSKKEDMLKAVWGLVLENKGDRVMVKTVLEDSPAYQAGVNTGDELLALGEHRLLAADATTKLSQHRSQESDTLLVSRSEKLVSLPITLGEHDDLSWDLVPIKKPSSEQTSAVKSWLSPEKQGG